MDGHLGESAMVAAQDLLCLLLKTEGTQLQISRLPSASEGLAADLSVERWQVEENLVEDLAQVLVLQQE
jgi:hypothetical protein